MTKTAHICKALLKGEVLTIMDGFKKYAVTNIPREVSRQIEKKFDVHVSRDKVEFTTDSGLPGWYFRYRLNHTILNEPGIQRMKEYIEEHFPPDKEKIIHSQTALF